jgi:U3 small nucleolar RNA-associated protein 20
MVENTAELEREKPIYLRKLESIISSKTIPDLFTGIIEKYCLALFSENFAPLWPNLTKTLIVCANTDRKSFWRECHQFISALSTYEEPRAKPKISSNKRQKQLVSFECTSLNDQNATWKQIKSEMGDIHNSPTVNLPFVDTTNCYILTIKLLGKVPNIFLENSRFLVPLFQNILSKEEQSKNARIKILAFLESFAKISKPRKLYDSHNVYNNFLGLLSNGDSRLQSSSLECILTWQHHGMIQYSDLLKGMVDDDKLRDSVSVFDMVQVRETVEASELPLLIDVVCRILYGKVVSRKGRSSSKAGIKSKRIAIFNFLATMNDRERSFMLNLMLEPFQNCLVGIEPIFKIAVELQEMAPLKKQIGFLNVIEDFILQLRSLVMPSVSSIISVILHMIHHAEKVIESCKEFEDFIVNQSRQIKTLGLKRLSQLYSINLEFDFTPFIKQHFDSFINSKIDKLSTENTQATSGILELFGAWARDKRFISFLTDYNSQLVPSLLLLLSAKKVHDNVVSFIVGIVESIQDAHDQFSDDNILPAFFGGHISLLLSQYENVLNRIVGNQPKPKLSGENIPTRIIKSLARISSFVEDSETAEKLTTILLPFLKSSDKLVPESTKTEILNIFCNFLPILSSMKTMHPNKTIYYPILAQLFIILQTREARMALIKVYRNLAKYSNDLTDLYTILDDLNAWSTKRLDEPDFDRRFAAFSKINQELYKKFTTLEWQPILYTLFYYVNDIAEFSIRSSASHGIKLFMERVKTATDEPDMPTFESFLIHLIFPQIKKGIKEAVQPSRDEFITLLGTLVKLHGNHDQFSDMVCLMGDINDDETNFFSNIVHLQVHRRIKALRQLSNLSRENKIKSSNVSNIFVSLCAHFVFSSDKQKDHNLINESMTCIAALTSCLAWGPFYNVLKRFMNSLKFRADLEKTLIKLLVNILDEFHFEMSDQEHMEIDEESNAVDQERDEEIINFNSVSSTKIHTIVVQKLLPSLSSLIEVQNDETVPSRVPLAVAIAKLLLKLPKKSMHIQLPKLLLNLCNILSSHLQSSRDSARSTLVTISSMLGSEYLHYIISSLRTALKRGYQLHVLGYTLHAIMAENVEKFPARSIDICVKQIVEITMYDIFGETGKERQVQELKGKMREIRTTKSFDTLEYLCKLISFNQLENVLKPLKEQMLDANQSSIVRNIEQVFRKVALGLNRNESIDLVNFLIFVQKLLSESLPLAKADNVIKKQLSDAEKYIKVQMKRSDAQVNLKYYEANVYLFIEFGLSLLLTSLKREKISSREQSHLEMVDPLIPLIGKAFYSNHSSINILAMKIYGILIKWTLPELTSTNPVIVKRLFQLIAKSSSTDSDLIQNVFKLLAIILRDCPHVCVQEKNIITLIALLGPDIEEPDKQTTTFSLIRAILERKIVAIEIYDLMDAIARVLITSQSNQVRELCRHAYIQFLTNYPHGHVRLRKQMTFLVSNLEYEFESGRISVLELLNLAVKNFSAELFLEYVDMLFLATVMVLANDDSSKCKEMASFLIKSILNRLDISKLDKPLLLIEKWFGQDIPELQMVGCQVISLINETFGERVSKWAPGWCASLAKMLQKCLDEWVRGQYENDWDQDLPLWELGYVALKALSKIMRVDSGNFLQSKSSDQIWVLIYELSNHPHQWIRLICSQMIGAIFSKIDANTRCISSASNCNDPFTLVLGELELKNLAKKCCHQLDSDLLTVELSKQVVKNLFFISKALLNFSLTDGEQNESNSYSEDEELPSGSSLLSLLKKLSYLARRDGLKKRGHLLRSSVFQYFAALFRQLPLNFHEIYLKTMLSTLYHTAMDETFKGDDAGKKLN